VGATRSIGLPRLRSKLFGSDQDLRIRPQISREDSRGRFAPPGPPPKSSPRSRSGTPIRASCRCNGFFNRDRRAGHCERAGDHGRAFGWESARGIFGGTASARRTLTCLSARACTDGSGATHSMKSRPFSPPTLLLAHARMKRSTPQFLSLFIWPAQLCDEMQRRDIWGRTEDAGHILTRSFGRSEVARRCELQLWHQQSPTSEYLA
jgi:hypothetical protein